MKLVSFLVAAAVLSSATPLKAEDVQVIVMNSRNRPRAVPVYWTVDGTHEVADMTSRKGTLTIPDLNCKKAKVVFFLRYEDIATRNIDPRSHKCKPVMRFVVH